MNNLLKIIKAEQLSIRKERLPSSGAIAALLTTLIGEVEMIGKNANREVTDAEVISTIQKFIKNMDFNIEKTSADHPLHKSSLIEKAILSVWLPTFLSETELKDHITNIHAGLLSEGSAVNIGTVMKVLKGRFEGRYDGKLASTLIRTELR